MIIVVAALEFASEVDRDKAVALTADVQRLTREEEPGCHDYCFAPDPAVPTRMQVYELWEDSASLAAHFEHPYYERMASSLQGVGIVESTNQAYLVERGEPVYTEAGEKKSGFFED
ncbi:MAG: antibiotic biosynthesis monooxygenase [Proteobacteria bacterium]|nr:antibiotic biosynthesis monooxygenase [Luminiphilus sp.]MDA0651465.1 antibiotic biosynthesis monooxygenase [Pseudomonadota bacterium]